MPCRPAAASAGPAPPPPAGGWAVEVVAVATAQEAALVAGEATRLIAEAFRRWLAGQGAEAGGRPPEPGGIGP